MPPAPFPPHSWNLGGWHKTTHMYPDDTLRKDIDPQLVMTLNKISADLQRQPDKPVLKLLVQNLVFLGISIEI